MDLTNIKKQARKQGKAVLYLTWTVAHGKEEGFAYQDLAEFVCPKCGHWHATIYVITRRLAETFGHFPVYRIGGNVMPVDGTLPTQLERIPRDAIRLTVDESADLWHRDGHYFG